MRAVVFGTNGELATAIAKSFLKADWGVEQVGRQDPTPLMLHDAYVFPQGKFIKRPFVAMSNAQLDQVVDIGLMSIVQRLRECLAIPSRLDRRVDYCLIGSTSSYQGFVDTAMYCAVKFALRGLAGALNDEYHETNRRFWLFSPGTMDTAMGRELTDQDASTFLSPDDVADRIVSTITAQNNLFEPEVIIRRRVVR